MKWTTENIPVKQLATGEILSMTTHTLSSGVGPHIHIQASVHGAELQGNAVILQLMEELKKYKLHGSITFIPLANPYATNNKHGSYTYGRYNPVTGHNWNRNYVDFIKELKVDLTEFCQEHFELSWHELKLAYKDFIAVKLDQYIEQKTSNQQISSNNKINLILQKLALRADGILDLHTGPTATRYLYAAQYEESVAQYLLFKNILVIPNEFGGAMDEASFMPWIHLITKMQDLGRPILCDVEAFTFEFGSEETFCMEEATKDVKSIINYLTYKGMIEGKVEKLDKSFYCQLKDFKTIFCPIGGLVDYKVKPGDHYKKDDVLANLYQLKKLDPSDPLNSTITPIIALEDGIVINRCPSSAVHEGMELLQIMSHTYSK